MPGRRKWPCYASLPPRRSAGRSGDVADSTTCGCDDCKARVAQVYMATRGLRCPYCHGNAHPVRDGERTRMECTHGCGWTSDAGGGSG